MSAAKIRRILRHCEKGLGGMDLLRELNGQYVNWDYGHMTGVLENMADVEYTKDGLWKLKGQHDND